MITKLFKLLKTFILYASVLFRIFLIYLLFIIGIILIKYSNNRENIDLIKLFVGKMMLFILSINVEISREDYNKYINYAYSDEKFISAITHKSLIDIVIYFGTLPLCSCIMNKQKEFDYIFLDDKLCEKTGTILINRNKPGSGTTTKIKENLDKRKSGDPILFMAPGAGVPPDNPDNISSFKGKGAFVNKSKILPLVLIYQDNTIDYNGNYGESMFNAYLKVFLIENYKVKIIVGDMIEPDESESIQEYSDRVYNIMNNIYKNSNLD